MELRVRTESWDWFDPGAGEDDYSFAHARWRGRIGYRLPKEWEVLLEVQDVQTASLPGAAIGPGPVGQMGLGGTLFGHSTRSCLNAAGIRQAYVKVGDPEGFQAQFGRMEYGSGSQFIPKDKDLAQIKRTRLGGRLIGTFDFSVYGRTFDGLRLDGDTEDLHVTGFLAHPTQGGFEPHFAAQMGDVSIGELSFTFKPPDGDAQLFWTYYGDNRLVPQLDNRTDLAARGQIGSTGGNQLHTLGGHLVHKLRDHGDVLLWFAHQTGEWGNLSHSANAFSGEVGYRWKDLEWKPWLRGGYAYFSGDDNPNDAVHTTFSPLLPTIRPYAMTPFFTTSNLRDAFAQVLLQPGLSTSARADVHFLNLDTPNDLWYVGSGATQNRGSINGFAGRPGGGGTHLGTLLDFGVEHQFDAQHRLGLYIGHIFGGDVTRSIYKKSGTGNFFFLEYNLKL